MRLSAPRVATMWTLSGKSYAAIAGGSTRHESHAKKDEECGCPACKVVVNKGFLFATLEFSISNGSQGMPCETTDGSNLHMHGCRNSSPPRQGRTAMRAVSGSGSSTSCGRPLLLPPSADANTRAIAKLMNDDAT